MSETLDFLRFAFIDPLQDWARGAFFERDLFFLLSGLVMGTCIGVWIITPRWR